LDTPGSSASDTNNVTSTVDSAAYSSYVPDATVSVFPDKERKSGAFCKV
jgi:hypothetical protein